MLDLEISPLLLTFHRTTRLENDDTTYNLPCSNGVLEIYSTKDYKCPPTWDKDAYFVAVHPEEAIWVGFQTLEPVALVVGLGNKNVLTDKNLNLELEKDNYITIPPQLWLDGWKAENGKVNQFIATGEPLSISIFESKTPNMMQIYLEKPKVICGDSPTEELDGEVTCCWGMSEVGGKVKQKIHNDPFGIDSWKKTPKKTIKIYLINGERFYEITKIAMPLLSKMDKNKWYDLKEAI
jgi:hypothetical protein